MTDQSLPCIPGAGDAWQFRNPADLDMDGNRLAQAAAFADAHETSWPRDLRRD